MPPEPKPRATATTGQPSWMAPVMPVVPDHELLRRIGGGSYGDVWLARTAVGTWRAVKVVFRDRFTDARPYEREFNGIQKFEPLSRSNEAFIDILQIGRNEAEGYFYYVMELADDAVAPVFQPASLIFGSRRQKCRRYARHGARTAESACSCRTHWNERTKLSALRAKGGDFSVWAAWRLGGLVLISGSVIPLGQPNRKQRGTSLPAAFQNTATVTATNRSVQLPITGPAQVFRLRQP